MYAKLSGGVDGYILAIAFTLVALCNTPHYNMGLDINWSVFCTMRFTMEFYKYKNDHFRVIFL